jgi:hypothetical protein
MNDTKTILREVRELGYTVERTGISHWKLIPPHKEQQIIYVGNSPSDANSIKAVRAALKRNERNKDD